MKIGNGKPSHDTVVKGTFSMHRTWQHLQSYSGLWLWAGDTNTQRFRHTRVWLAGGSAWDVRSKLATPWLNPYSREWLEVPRSNIW